LELEAVRLGLLLEAVVCSVGISEIIWGGRTVSGFMKVGVVDAKLMGAKIGRLGLWGGFGCGGKE
jgi:hypothetical protein